METYKVLRETAKSAPADLIRLERLRKAGSDLSKPTSITFYLYVPTKLDAEQAARALRHDGFGVTIRKGDPKEAEIYHWLDLASATHVPSVAYLNSARREFQGLSRIHGGIYDGWEAQIVRHRQ